MALQTKTISYGSFDRYDGKTNGYILDLIITEETVDVLANASEVSYKLQLRSGPSNRFNGVVLARVLFGETVVEAKEVNIVAAYNTTYVLLTGQTTIPHNDDGSFSLSVSGTLLPYDHATNQFSPPIMDATGTVELTQIARASTVAATSVFIGDTATIVVNRSRSDYVHSIRYQFGELNGYISDSVGRTQNAEIKIDATTILFPIPETFYLQIPNDPSGVCVLTCTTYSGDTQIGNPQTAQFTITADPARSCPLVTAVAVDINPQTIAVTGNDKILIEGRSNAGCTVTAQSRYGSSITAVFVAGTQVQELEHIIEGVTTADIMARAVDSRGYSAEYVIPDLELIRYTPLSFYASASRTDPTSGNAILQISGKWYGGSLGASENRLSARYRIDNGAWVEFQMDTAGGDIDARVDLTGLEYRYAHTIEVEVWDLIDTVIKKVSISKGIPVFDWGENDFCFNVPVIFTATDGSRFSLDLIDGQLQVRRTT